MKTLSIRFLKDFYTPIPQKKTHKAGDVINIEVDSENFPLHSFWQSQFLDNSISKTFEIVEKSEDSDSKNLKKSK